MSAAAPLPKLPTWHRAFRDLTHEHGFQPLAVRGTLPSELRGVLYRTGPAMFTQPDGRPYEHWFDGDGAVSAIRFDGAGASGAVKFVQSDGRQREQAAHRTLFGSYGTRA